MTVPLVVEYPGVVPVRHPLFVAGGLFLRCFCFWFSQLVWPHDAVAEGPGVSFVELAISFLVDTATPLPVLIGCRVGLCRRSGLR